MGQKYKENEHVYLYGIAFFTPNEQFYAKKPYFCSQKREQRQTNKNSKPIVEPFFKLITNNLNH